MSLEETFWSSVQDAVAAKHPLAASDRLKPHGGSTATYRGALYFLASLADGQDVFIEISAVGGQSPLGVPVAEKTLADDKLLRVLRTSAPVIDRYCQIIKPEKSPRALGAIPRLGVGTRMTTAMWPGVYRAMDGCAFSANPIQNSVRELNLLQDVLDARPPEAIDYPGFGTVESGHTGSTFAGLWVYGVLEALKSDTHPVYGADADHIKVLGGTHGMSHAYKVLDATSYYTFFTLDVSGVLDYGALARKSHAAAEAYLSRKIPSAEERRAVIAHHGQRRRIGGATYQIDTATLGRLVGKYWDAMWAAQELTSRIRQIRGPRPFDLEFAIDEPPPGVAAWEAITTDVEVAFVLLELQRRRLPVTHLAPSFGVEKGVDYRCPDGLQGLEARVRSQHKIAAEFGVLLDFHSGDDLSQETRRVIGGATKGRHHFKISPEPQMIFAETVHDFYPKLFVRWWNDANAYARREAVAGSQFAVECLTTRDPANAPSPSARDSVFHNFGFAFVGRRDDTGQFLNREEIYGLSSAFYREYQDRVESYLCLLIEDLFAA